MLILETSNFQVAAKQHRIAFSLLLSENHKQKTTTVKRISKYRHLEKL